MSIRGMTSVVINYIPFHSIRQILCVIKIDELRLILILLIQFFFILDIVF